MFTCRLIASIKEPTFQIEKTDLHSIKFTRKTFQKYVKAKETYLNKYTEKILYISLKHHIHL